MDGFETLLGDVRAFITQRRESLEELFDQIAVPGAEVYVLHDGRKGWMYGAKGRIIAVEEEWAKVMFSTKDVRKFRLKRLSRTPNGLDCYQAMQNFRLRNVKQIVDEGLFGRPTQGDSNSC